MIKALAALVVAAAAMESRAFPAFTYDPSAGGNWAARFNLDANPQVELDWSVQHFEYEDENQQRVAEDVAFTVIDFVACDRRYSRHFARVPRARWNKNLVPASECIARAGGGMPEQVPCVLMVDRQSLLQKVIVDDRLVRAAQRCRDAWHSLQELGGRSEEHTSELQSH